MSSGYTIREAAPDDAEKVLAYMKTIADERDNGISFESAADLTWSIEETRDILKNHADADNSLWLVAVAPDGELIGHVNVYGGRGGYYGTLTLTVTVAQGWRSKGIGTALMQRLIDWCRKNPVVHRLHLMVFPNNPRALHVYEKLGFKHEGTWESAFKKQGEWLDLVQMAMLFNHE